jgi:hypothetical protein
MAARTPRFIAGGNINPASFVKIDTTVGNNFFVVQATADTDKIIGIAQQGTYQPPGVTGSDGLAAHSGQPVQVYGLGEETLLQIAGTVTQGDLLKTNASGFGLSASITVTGTAVKWVGAIALESGVSGDWIRVLVLPQALPGTTV